MLNLDESKIKPRLMWLSKASSGDFTCFSSTKVLWTFNNSHSLPVGVLPRINNTLHIDIAIRSFHQGDYECDGTSADGQKFSALGQLYVYGQLVLFIELFIITKMTKVSLAGWFIFVWPYENVLIMALTIVTLD